MLVLSLLLIRGIRESAFVNGLIVITKVAIVVLFIVIGWGFINPANHMPYIPPAGSFVDATGVSHHYGGLMGILGAGGVVFFAFIGFDAVSTAAQEAKNPKRDMPIGILGSLAICTVLYILFAHVLTGVASVEDFRTQGKEASVVYAITTYMHGYGWLAKFVTVAILAGFSSVILVMLLGQSRVFFAMSRDGLVPKVFSETHPQLRHALQVEPDLLRVRRRVRRLRARRHRRRHDQHRHAVRVHARVRGRLDPARAAAPSCRATSGRRWCRCSRSWASSSARR